MQVSYPLIYVDFDIDADCNYFEKDCLNFSEGSANKVMNFSKHDSKLTSNKGNVKLKDQTYFGFKQSQTLDINIQQHNHFSISAAPCHDIKGENTRHGNITSI